MAIWKLRSFGMYNCIVLFVLKRHKSLLGSSYIHVLKVAYKLLVYIDLIVYHRELYTGYTYANGCSDGECVCLWQTIGYIDLHANDDSNKSALLNFAKILPNRDTVQSCLLAVDPSQYLAPLTCRNCLPLKSTVIVACFSYIHSHLSSSIGRYRIFSRWDIIIKMLRSFRKTTVNTRV